MQEIVISEDTLEDDDMINLIKDNFNETEMELFKLNYQIYTENKNNTNSYVVNLDKVYKWIGFSRKDHAKTLLSKYFFLNKDNIIENQKDYLLPQVREQIKYGHNKELILLKFNLIK
jgi:hypothetical protein